MFKLLIIICCEVISNGVYSYEVGYVDDSKKYTVTVFASQKYEVGDTIGFFDGYSHIDWSDTLELYKN